MVWSTTGTSYTRTSVPDYLDWKEQATSFEYLEVYRPREINVQHANGLERTRARQVSVDGHRLLGEGIFLGRDFAPDESSPGKDRVALLTHKFWQQSFDDDRGVVGREIGIDSIPHTVVGVLPPGPQDRRPANVWRWPSPQTTTIVKAASSTSWGG